ncbi:MAG: YSC84-related protein [Xanthomonadales bacterium]|nr:YSC84-related protein [Xanthomonadales bacterium]
MKNILLACMALALTACAVTPSDGYKSHRLDDATEETIYQFEQVDPGIGNLFRNSIGYAVFPTVGAGAAGVGGAYGKGQVYERGRLVGYCDLSQASIGFQFGGQAYSQVIFFNSQDALDWFKSGDFSFSGQASAVALDKGVSANANFRNGVAVYTRAKGGLMYQASIGGQKFRFEPAG